MANSNNDIIIRIPRKMYDQHIQRMIDYIEYKKIVSKSKATQKDVNKLVDDIKKERRPRVKALLRKANIKL